MNAMNLELKGEGKLSNVVELTATFARLHDEWFQDGGASEQTSNGKQKLKKDMDEGKIGEQGSQCSSDRTEGGMRTWRRICFQR